MKFAWPRQFRFALFFVAAAFALYGRSLSYGFVYDDHWRVEQNAAVRTFQRLDRYFWDRTTSSSLPALHRDNYRPLVTLSFALDAAVSNAAPAFFRSINILLHGLNATLVAVLAAVVLGASLPAQLLAGLFFLVHPIQTESVVWIAERTNVMGLFFTLIAWRLWVARRFGWFHVFFAAALLTRESAACLPLLVMLTDFFQARSPSRKNDPLEWRAHYGFAFGQVAVYLAVRAAVLGQIKMAPYWGGNFGTNVANVFSFWLEYPRSVLWPFPLRITYAWLPVAESWTNPRALTGFFSFAAAVVAVVQGWKGRQAWVFCLAAFIILWAPGSNLVPLTTPFAERLLYPLMVPAAWFFGIALARARRPLQAAAVAILVILSVLTFDRLSDWRTDFTLWKGTTETTPQSWFAWANLGELQTRDAINRGAASPAALASLRKALSYQVPVGTAGTLFLYMAQLDLLDGDTALADQHAARALALNPALTPLWETRRRSYVITSSSR